MAVTKRLRTTGHGTPVALFTGQQDPRAASAVGAPNMGTADVRGNSQSTQVITLHGYDGTDSFKIQVNYPSAELDSEETAAIVRGTNATAAAVETALQNLAGLSDVTVAGTTDEGPFTVTFVTDVDVDSGQGTPVTGRDLRFRGVGAVLALSDLSGCSGKVTVTDPTYVAALGRVQDYGTDTGVPTATFPGNHAGDNMPLGTSAWKEGLVYPTPTALLPPVIDSAIGGSATVAILGTEDASGAAVLYVITNADTGETVSIQTDADADVAATTLVAGEYFLVGYSTTTVGTDNAIHQRVSKPSPREYFTVS